MNPAETSIDLGAAPQGYHTVTPYLTLPRVEAALDFMTTVFSAKTQECVRAEDGQIMHAEMQIGDSRVMVGHARDDVTPTPATLYVYLDDPDGAYARALAAGARSLQEPTQQYYGDRTAAVIDTHGNRWWLARRVEDLTAEELEQRARER